MSSFRKIGLTVAVLTGLAAAGVVVAADEAGQRGCAGEPQAAAGHGEHRAHGMQRMSEMHKRMQGGEHRHRNGEQKQGGEQKQDKPQQPQGEEHNHS